jgi:hypothetical protein
MDTQGALTAGLRVLAAGLLIAAAAIHLDLYVTGDCTPTSATRHRARPTATTST